MPPPGFLMREPLRELTVAVVHHDEDVRLQIFDEPDEFPDLFDRERRAHLITLGPLDGEEFGLLVHGGFDAVPVEGSVGKQVDLAVRDAVLGERAGGLPDADDFFERVIGLPHRAQQFVSRQEVRRQRRGQRVGTAGDLRAHESRLGVEDVGVDFFQHIATEVIVAVTGGPGKTLGGHAVLLHGMQHLVLVVCHGVIQFIEQWLYFPFAGIDQIENFFRYPEFVNEYIF